MSKRSAIVVGVGAEKGSGAAVSRKFAAEGYHVFVGGRTAARIEQVVKTIRDSGGSAEAVVVDATSEADVIALFDRAFASYEPDAVIFNAGDNARIDLRDLDAATFERMWRVGCFAGFLVGREAARRLVPLGRGTVLFTGASASLRGKGGFAQFAAAKAGLRMISQSMARDYGPLGLHVAHIVIDGGIDGARLEQGQPERYAKQAADTLLDISAIADAYWYLHTQHRSAWTQELDLRPGAESF